MDDDAVGMRNQQASPDLAIDRYIRAGHHRPETMAEHGELAPQPAMLLIIPDAREQLLARAPLPGPLPLA